MSAERAVLPAWAITRLGYQPGQFVEEHQIREGVRRLEHQTGRTISLRVEPEPPAALDEAQVRALVEAALAEQIAALTATVTTEVTALRERLAEAERDANAFRTLITGFGTPISDPECWCPPDIPSGTQAERTRWLVEHFEEAVAPSLLGQPVRVIWRTDFTKRVGSAYMNAAGERVIEALPERPGRPPIYVLMTLTHELLHHALGHCERPVAAACVEDGQSSESGQAHFVEGRRASMPDGFATLEELVDAHNEYQVEDAEFKLLKGWGVYPLEVPNGAA